jgi:Methylamine utilisation protein MauE
MLNVAVRCGLALVLVAAAATKLAQPRRSRAALATFGIRSEPLARVAWGAVVTAELGLAAGVALGSSLAAYLAAGMLLAFAAGLELALAQGRAGAPCACFGSGSRVSTTAVARNVALALAFAVTPSLPGHEATTEQWLGLGLAVALLGLAALGVAVLALAREVGLLRSRLAPEAALDVRHEGPELGSRSDAIARFDPDRSGELALAVFTSEGCHACTAVEPELDELAREPLVALRLFDERRDADVWSALDVPGSPFAVALARDGTVLAKGTFNTRGQLEGVLAVAERRLREGARA